MAWLRTPVKGVMLDISGVLKNGNVAIPGSIEAVQRLRKCGLKLRFVTNETQLSRHDLTEKLRRIGFQLHENEVFPPAPAMVETLKELRLNPMLLVHPKVLIDFKDVDQSNPNCVVVGDAAEHFTYERMNSAFRLLMELKNPRLFTLGRGRYYLEEDGLCLDVGCFTTALEFATALKAEIVGKPSCSFFVTPLKDMGLDSSEVVMIGDDVESDVGGAQKCGMRGVLVRTGKFRPERDENHPHVKPDAVVNDLAQAVELILSSKSDNYVRRGGKGHRNRKRLSKTDIGIPQDFVHVATVKSPTKTEVNFNDALISEFLQRAEVSAAALSDPETQRCIKDFIEKVGLDAIHRELNQTKVGVFSQINTGNEGINHTEERELYSSKVQSNDSSSIAFIGDHDIEITPEIDDVFTESETSIASPTIHNQKDSKKPSKLKLSIEDTCDAQNQFKSEDLQKSPNPSDSGHIRESVSGNEASTPKKRPDHDNFLRELKEAIKKRNARLKKRAADEMNKSEEGWTKWNSPKKSKSYKSFFQLDSPPAKPSRIIHTFWDLTSETHYHSEKDINEIQTSDSKNIDCTDDKKLSPNSAKLPLTKRTGAITKIAEGNTASSSEDDSKTKFQKEVNGDDNIEKMKQNESNKEFLYKSIDEPASAPVNEGIRGENDNEISEGKEYPKNVLKANSSQKKNISLWFTTKDRNKAANKATLDGLPADEKKAKSTEQENGNDVDVNESSNNKGEEKGILSIFSSLTKKKQTKEEESASNVETPDEERSQPKSKISSSKFRLFGSSERLIEHEKTEKENKKGKEEKRVKKNTELTSTETEFFVEIPLSENATELQDEPFMLNKKENICGEIDEASRMSPKKAKTPGKMNFLFVSGKQTKNKPEEIKEEVPKVTKEKLADSIREEDRYESWDKSKHSAFVNLLFAPPERHAKKVKSKNNSQDNKDQEEFPLGADSQNSEVGSKEEKEFSSDNNKESSVEHKSSKANAEVTNEEKQGEKQDTVTKDESQLVTGDEVEKSTSKEEKKISEGESSIKIEDVQNSSENVAELKNEEEQDVEKSKEVLPTIIITQDGECTCEKQEENFDEGEISSEMASDENFIDPRDKTEQQEMPMVIEEINNVIIVKEEESGGVEGKELSMDSTVLITEITKCFEEINKVKHEDSSEEKQESITDEEISNHEKSNSTSETISTVTINATFVSKDHTKETMDDAKDEIIMGKDFPVNSILEEKNNEGGIKFSTKEKRSSGIIDSLFARPEKHAKPKQDKKKLHSSKNEYLNEESMDQRDGNLDEESANKMESTENEPTNKNKPVEVSEDQSMIDTHTDDPGKQMITSLDRAASSSRMQTLFGSTGKYSKSKKNLKQDNISKKQDLSSAAVGVSEDLKSEEEINSSSDKAKSFSMRHLLFGKHPKPKYEETKDMPTLRDPDVGENADVGVENPIVPKGSSTEISPLTIPAEGKMEKQYPMMVELQEKASESNKQIQKEDNRTSRKINPASEKPSFFSLPDRKGRLDKNDIKNQENEKSEVEPQSTMKENKEEGKHSYQSNLNTPKKKGFLSSLDKRKVRHEARKPEVSLEKEDNSEVMKPGNVQSINNKRERLSLSGTETSTNQIVEFPNERAVDVGEINEQSSKFKSESKEDLLKSSPYPRRKGRKELKKEDITLQMDMRHTTHVTWDPIKKNFVLHYTDNEGLRKILLEKNLCREAPAPRQRRHSYSMAMDDSDTEIFEEIPRASVQSYISVKSNSRSSWRRKKVPIARPRSEIVRGNQPLTEL